MACFPGLYNLTSEGVENEKYTRSILKRPMWRNR